jgi:NAD(P)H-dependent flavin oxidoreductase YrpB (nitropropane dioxygenase family)
MNKFNTKYPILAAPMNRVSDAKLAVAVANAGCIPSFSIFNYIGKGGNINYDLLQKDLYELTKKTKFTNVVLSVGTNYLHSSQLQNIVKQTKVSHIEVITQEFTMYGTTFDYGNHKLFENLSNLLIPYQDMGIGIILKCLTKFCVLEAERYYHRNFDYYLLKGEDGAGTVVKRETPSLLIDEIKEIKEYFPDIKLIVAGGIGNGKDAKLYIDAGADIIALGTAFAMCKESCVSVDAKNKILKSKKIKQFEGKLQNAVMFKKYDGDDDLNHTMSLHSGVAGNSKGHVFIGKGIEKIDDIVTVNHMIQQFIGNM